MRHVHIPLDPSRRDGARGRLDDDWTMVYNLKLASEQEAAVMFREESDE